MIANRICSGSIGHAAMMRCNSVKIAALFAALCFSFRVFFEDFDMCSRPSGTRTSRFAFALRGKELRAPSPRALFRRERVPLRHRLLTARLYEVAVSLGATAC